MRLAILILQVATTAVHGIITQQSGNTSTPAKFEEERSTLIKFEDEKSAPRHSRKISETPPKIQNWKSILKDATFQSLIKHTAFTPSLEEKMESDRLLWEKLQSAKFLRKATGKGEDPNEKVKMGVLLDMTTDGGSLEFRQSDRSVYTCPDNKCEEVLQRLLAIWKVQRFEPNDTWIRIKVPRHNHDEDVYEYTPKHGLQQMNTRFSKISNSARSNITTTHKKNEADALPNTLKTPEVNEPVLDERMSRRRMDSGKSTIYEVKHLRTKDYLINKGAIETSDKYIPYSIPQTVSQQIHFTSTSDKPRKNLFFQIQPVAPEVTGVEPKVIKQFKDGNSGFYDGFMPSLGPTGSPFTTIDYGLQFAKNFPKFTEYATEIWHNTGNRGKISFRPSPKFVQYSEPDPFYHSEMGSTMPPQEKEPFPVNFSPELNNTLKNVNIEATPQPQKNNITDAISKLTTELEYEEQTDSSINVSRFADTKGNEIHLTTKSPIRKLHTKTKNQLKSILRVSSGEVQDYAPLYAKWGEKIKTTSRPTTSKTLVLVSKDIKTTTTERITSAPSMQKLDKKLNVESSKTQEDEGTVLNSIRNTTQKTANMVLEGIVDKSPEEIVNALTNLGVNNTTRVEGYPPVSEKTLETSSKMLEKMSKDTKSLAHDPISLIVNRISQSYSYRTSNGKIKNFRKMRRRLGHS